MSMIIIIIIIIIQNLNFNSPTHIQWKTIKNKQ